MQICVELASNKEEDPKDRCKCKGGDREHETRSRCLRMIEWDAADFECKTLH